MFIIQNIHSTETAAVLMACLKYSFPHKRFSLENVCDAPDGTPVGSMEFVRAYADSRNIILPSFDTYPSIPKKFYGRSISETTIKNVLDSTQKIFVKPKMTKQFTGFVYDPSSIKTEHDEEQISLMKSSNPLDVCYVSPPIEFICEVRFYIQDSKMIGYGRYDAHPQEDFWVDYSVVRDILSHVEIQHPYTIDVGLTHDMKTLVVEFNDAYAIGLYDRCLDDKTYANFLKERWRTIQPATDT